MRPSGPRDPVAGPNTGPEPPFPIRLSGPVIKGFGRGSKELGIPTANIPADGLAGFPDLQTGVYYGVVALDPAQFVVEDGGGGGDGGGKGKAVILPAVLSIGFNPFYKNTVRSVEIHIMRSLTSSSAPEEEGKGGEGQVKFHKMADFYSTKLNLLILGYIRPEYDYVSVEALIEDIRIDCEVARRSLLREAYICYLQDRGTGTDAVKEQREWLVRF